MIGTENFWWSEENYCDSRHLRGNIDGFLPDGIRANINRNTNWSRCDICVQNVESAGSAGPRGPATWTDSDDFFFLERASPTPTWIRPLVPTDSGPGPPRGTALQVLHPRLLRLKPFGPCWTRLRHGLGAAAPGSAQTGSCLRHLSLLQQRATRDAVCRACGFSDHGSLHRSCLGGVYKTGTAIKPHEAHMEPTTAALLTPQRTRTTSAFSRAAPVHRSGPGSSRSTSMAGRSPAGDSSWAATLSPASASATKP